MRRDPTVLVANRGEIAVRVIEACRTRGLRTVLAVSDVDRATTGAQLADEVVCIGPAPPARSYLLREALVVAAQRTGAAAIHPGYGFLAEDESFAAMCSAAGLIFLGPTVEHLRLFGDKVRSRETAESAGVPLSLGSAPLAGEDDAVMKAREIGFPVILKAVAGGGGRGMRIANEEEELRRGFSLASAEAAAAFGDPRLYLEQWIARARHVEVQLIGDGTGHVVHLGDRDCSIQRRNQKLIEEAPAPKLELRLQESIRAAAVELAQSVNYKSAGTVEFLVDPDSNRFYFLEVNPRIQVEHGITELVTGLDIVQLQLDVGIDDHLGIDQADVSLVGSAIECRINAEDPSRNFQPSPGRIVRWEAPKGRSVRVDTHCYGGYFVPPYYDSLLAKLMVVADDRNAAIERMASCLGDFNVTGIETNISLSQYIVRHEDFRKVNLSTVWLDTHLRDSPEIFSDRHPVPNYGGRQGVIQ